MDVDDDDDFYAPEESVPATSEPKEEPRQTPAQGEVKSEQSEDGPEEGEEEGEEVEEDDDSDIDIITERKDGTKAAPPSNARYNDIRNIAQRTASNDVTHKASAPKKSESAKPSLPASGADLPAVATSKIDVDAKPMYDPARKPITQVNIDEDLPDNDKPWRRPGTDISDYFNYGFDEFTWALYAAKQESLRSEYDQSKLADNQKKMMEDMNMMMSMGSMPGMPGGAGAGMGMGAMPGMEGMPPGMEAMMQQMMASGMDPSQMDPSAMFAGMAGQGGAAAGQAAGQNAGFGGQAFGQGNQQQQMGGYGFDQGMGNTGGAANRGNFRGRGRGHRNW
ncbi:hypothetical protein V496_07935 [Pseudogymnoascus sp. VKM F-4515 (FW-2607)]|nr:hypothetical protein V496_07935 [Pseudogymnoascus sp. VKM F-4515 (FW-2607)]KFY96658.1 hypothetical protein V498_02563 [Pseudogymnoascus sp. VKM F-4517 (FW-2822)]